MGKHEPQTGRARSTIESRLNRLAMTLSLPHLLQRGRFAKEAIGASNF
jgi:hypothetical protein